jgi:hypothetical protein
MRAHQVTVNALHAHCLLRERVSRHTRAFVALFTQTPKELTTVAQPPPPNRCQSLRSRCVQQAASHIPKIAPSRRVVVVLDKRVVVRRHDSGSAEPVDVAVEEGVEVEEGDEVEEGVAVEEGDEVDVECHRQYVGK